MAKRRKPKIKVIYQGYARITIFKTDEEPGKMQCTFTLSIEDDKVFAEQFLKELKE